MPLRQLSSELLERRAVWKERDFPRGRRRSSVVQVAGPPREGQSVGFWLVAPKTHCTRSPGEAESGEASEEGVQSRGRKAICRCGADNDFVVKQHDDAVPECIPTSQGPVQMSQQGLVFLQLDASGLRRLDQEDDCEVILLKVLCA